MRQILTRLLAVMMSLVLILPQVSAAQGFDPAARGLAVQAQTTASAAKSLIARSQNIVVSTRMGGLGGLNTTNKTDGTVSGATYRVYHLVPAATDIADLVLTYANWSWTQSNGEVVGDNAITVKAYVEYNGVSYPVYFNGAQTVTIQPGQFARYDPLPIRIPAGSVYWTRTYVTANGVSSGTWPLGPITNASNSIYDTNNYSTGGGDVASSTGNIGFGGAGYSFDAVSINGTALASTKSIGFIGDSITAGTGESGSLSIWFGPMERAFTNKVPWVRMTRSGYKSQNIGGTFSRAAQLFGNGRVTSLITELGVNDLSINAGSFPSFVAAKIAEWQFWAARGIPLYQTTITPQTSSTDGWTTVAGQTIYNTTYNTVRVTFNDWLRAGAPMVNGAYAAIGTAGAITIGKTGHPLAGYIEVADAVETARNSGILKVATNARAVTDGAITSGTGTLTSATANFSAADLGAGVYVAGAGAGGAGLSAFISAVTNSTTVTLSVNASTTVSAASTKIGGLTQDGLHYNPAGYAVLAAPYSNALSSGLLSANDNDPWRFLPIRRAA